MNHYLINLAEDTARLQFQQSQFGQWGLSFERVEACRDDVTLWNRLRWWCAVLRPVVKGEIGCALSHVSIYRKMRERGESCAAVFEDDVRFSPVVVEALQVAEKACLKNSRCVVLLGNHRHTKSGEALAEVGAAISIVDERRDFCTEGYVIGLAAAAALEKAQRKVRVPADSWNYFRRKGWISLSRTSVPVCGQAVEMFGSELDERYVVADHGIMARIWWKFRRVIGVVLDGLLDGGRF